jgi:uptake hydrogenase large subunit
MSIEGEVRVSLLWDGRRVQRASVQSTRPPAAARIALGRSTGEAATLVPTLFAICGHAQAAAAAAALRAAGARDDDMPEVAAWSVPLETIQEIFWRLLIDAPRALALAPQTMTVATARTLVAQAIAALRARADHPKKTLHHAAAVLGELAREQVYGREPAAWLEVSDVAAFDDWRDRVTTLPARSLAHLAHRVPGLGRSDTALMPGPGDARWWSAVVPALQHDAAFAQAPTWGGTPVETGALSRMREQPLVAALIERDGHSAATRIAARLVELAQLLNALRGAADDTWCWVQSWPLGAGVGLAAVQTARGLLLHSAQVSDDRVEDYRIVAPTEWNFHPDGALAHGLVGTEAGDEATLTARASLAVLALDPCVGFRVEVTRHA